MSTFSSQNSRNFLKLVALIGPTASGKTELAIKLSTAFPFYIISADSRQIYKEINIGTGKPHLGRKYRQCGQNLYRIHGVDHFMFNVCAPSENYSVAQFQDTVYHIINCRQAGTPEIFPFLVGGTGLYVDAVVENWHIPKVAPDFPLRKKLEPLSASVLFKRLKQLDPETALFIDRNNKRRLVRALEYVLMTKSSFSEARKKGSKLFDSLILGIDLPRTVLDKRIDRRVEHMMQQGLLFEVKKLVKKYDWDAPAMNGIGYRQFRSFFEGKSSLEKAVDQIKQDTRRYAKRQMTWFRRNKNIIWITNYSEAKRMIIKFLAF